MKIVNLDKITTKRDVVIILGGDEHVMHTPTVKDYIEQLKKAEKLSALAETATVDNAAELLEMTIDTLLLSFPTIKREQLQALNMDQLNAIRMLAEGASEEELTGEEPGEVAGKTD